MKQAYGENPAQATGDGKLDEFVFCTDIESSVREFIEAHYGHCVELYTAVQGGMHGFYTSVEEFAQMLEYLIGRRLCGRQIRMEIVEKNGLLSILIDSDECDITALGGDLALAVLATRAGFAVETDGNRLLLTAEVEMSGKDIVCAIARALLLYYLEAAYQRTRAEKKQKEGE